MDWEKQDNELRKLMDDADFLPDGERFDSAASWKKMQEKNNPSQKKIFAPWMRMAVAACIVGLLGLLIWRVQIQNDFTPADPVVNTNKANTKNVPQIPSALQALSIDSHQQKNASNEIESLASPSFQRLESKQKETEKSVIGTAEKNIAQQDVLIPETQKNIPAIKPDTPTETSNATAIALPIETSNTAATAAPKKPALRVVHYNDLKGNFSTPPPVFVQTKKSDNEWQQLVLQNAASSREHPLSIKIDINPAPKKSL
jgi:cytoskeletal protein RodZ